MQIHLDGIVLSLQRQGGITAYFTEFMKRLGSAGLDVSLTIETPSLEDLSTDDLRGIRVVERPARIAERYRDCRPISGFSEGIFHSTYYRRPLSAATPAVVTVHDFAYERWVGGPRAWIHSAQKQAAIRQAGAIICVSQATRDDLLEFVELRPGQSVHVVYNGVSDNFRPLDEPAPLTSGRRFVLFVGQRGRYKNFRLALEALALMPDMELHCVGGGALRESEMAHVDRTVRERVRHLGLVSNARLNELYNRAVCLVYPSAYEGFGIPVVEAMRAGCPVVCIACKAVLEIGGDALTVASSDPTGIAQAVARIASHDYRASVRQRGFVRSVAFGWQKHFEQTLAVYRTLWSRSGKYGSI